MFSLSMITATLSYTQLDKRTPDWAIINHLALIDELEKRGDSSVKCI